jgi:hypothetical protein
MYCSQSTLVDALEGNAVDVTEGNNMELSLLCNEFGFDGLTAQLSMFQQPGRWWASDAAMHLMLLLPQAVQDGEADAAAAGENTSQNLTKKRKLKREIPLKSEM